MRLERCPVCRARLREEPVCSRCGTGLSLPMRIAAQADALERRAIQELATGGLEAAEAAVSEALRLRRSPLSQAVSRFIAHVRAGR